MKRRQFLQTTGLASAAWLCCGQRIWSESTIKTRRNLYVLGQFEQTEEARLNAVAATLAGSQFNVFTLAFLGVDLSQGKLQLLYNGHAFSALSPRLSEILRRLQGGGIRKILLSIGGWQSANTFAVIRSTGIPAFVQQLTQQVITPLGLDGIDLDLEPMQGGLDQWMATYREHGATLALLTNEYKRIHPSHIVSHSPIAPVAAELYAKNVAMDDLRDGFLSSTRTMHGSNNINWLNVQLYEGGAVVGGDIATYYKESLVQPLLPLRKKTGIQHPLDFLQPTFQPLSKPPQSMEFCRQALIEINARCATLQGGRLQGVSLWEYKQIAAEISAWSQSMEEALAH